MLACPAISPLAQRRLEEALSLAVGLRPVGLRVLVGTNLPCVDAKWFEFTRLHAAWPQSERMVPAPAPHNGLPQSASETPLAAELAAQLMGSEAIATAALFPRATIAGYMMRTLWKTFSSRGTSVEAADMALAALPRNSLSPVARDVAARLHVEFELD